MIARHHGTRQANMSDQKDTSTAAAPTLTTLITLPVELQLNIIEHLDFFDKQVMRATNKHLRSLIEAPTRDELLQAEDSQPLWEKHLLYCNPCNRLRYLDKFSTSMRVAKKRANKKGTCTRWCIECGTGPILNDHTDMQKYCWGARWDDRGVPFVRCIQCRECAQAPYVLAVKLCLGCHSVVVERERARTELERVQRQRNEREERRVQWGARGRASSDFSEYDERGVYSDDGDEAYYNDMYGYADIENEMNYSAHS